MNLFTIVVHRRIFLLLTLTFLCFAGPAAMAGAERVGLEALKDPLADLRGNAAAFVMHPQDDVFELVEFLRVFLFNQDCGSYIAAEFVGNSHDGFLKE